MAYIGKTDDRYGWWRNIAISNDNPKGRTRKEGHSVYCSIGESMRSSIINAPPSSIRTAVKRYAR